MKLPDIDPIAEAIDLYYEEMESEFRPHIGASVLGHECDRFIWLSFRWSVNEHFPGRIRRLFRRGNLEEQTILSDLRAIGVDVGTRQATVDFGCHISGSADAIIYSGLPGAEKTKHVAEFKTHSLKSFNDLHKHGVQKSKPIHWVQMQVYMHGLKIDRALYAAVCKDDDRYYFERVHYDKEAAEAIVERGKRIALTERVPEMFPGASFTFYVCKFCPAHKFCYETKMTDHVNCRTCAHSTPTADSQFLCARHDNEPIPVEFQKTGCSSHALHPDLVPWQMRDGTDWSAAYEIDGVLVLNGEDGYASSELIANPSMCANPLPFVKELREKMDAKLC